jgi:hypothetical protein
MIFSLPIKYNVPSAYKPVNYTKVDSKLDGHLKGIDAKLATTTLTSTVLTGYTSGAGTVAATDSILSAIQKLDGNISGTNAPVTVTAATSTIPAAPYTLICNGTATHTVTLPDPANYIGKIINIKTIGAYAVNSTGSNVSPINSVTPGTAVLAATAGKWAKLQSDENSWVIIEAN